MDSTLTAVTSTDNVDQFYLDLFSQFNDGIDS
jgi:hypothetical protein